MWQDNNALPCITEQKELPMPSIPRDKIPDNTIPLLREGYTFISTRCDAMDTDIFETRLMLKKAICVRGAPAAEMFYHPDRFTRNGALPPTTVRLLQDKGSVQLQDGAEHHDRKAMFLAMMTPNRLERLTEIADEEWQAQLGKWKHLDSIVLFEEVRETLCRTVCRWAGVPLAEDEVAARTREFGAMIDNASRAGPRNVWAQVLRQRNERWARDIIQRARNGAIDAPAGAALSIIANHRDLEGKLLDVDVAAVELINVLRPTVAVTRFIVFEAVALHDHAAFRELVQHGDDSEVECFVQEVRRFYPFFPFIGGRARVPFEWDGHRFGEGDWVLLDLYGTDHDARIWDDPATFQPERFREWDGSAYNFVPQGAGDHLTTHRCPGEWVTIALMKQAATFLTRKMAYDAPVQDLSISLSRMPAKPKSGFVMSNIRSGPMTESGPDTRVYGA